MLNNSKGNTYWWLNPKFSLKSEEILSTSWACFQLKIEPEIQKVEVSSLLYSTTGIKVHLGL